MRPRATPAPSTASDGGWCPVYSLIIATEPLSESVWEQIGLRRRETFSDHRHLIIYGQRTADDRLVFGGRGAPYHFGSRIRHGVRPRRAASSPRSTPRSSTCSPCCSDAAGHPRLGWRPRHRPRLDGVGRSRPARPGSAGPAATSATASSTTNLAGRTLADLVLGRDTELTRLPWVGHRSRSWEPEPLRWLGINAGLRAMTWADHEEARTGRESRIAKLGLAADRLSGSEAVGRGVRRPGRLHQPGVEERRRGPGR